MVRGWKHTRWGYDSRTLPLLVDFGVTSKIDSWRCDIQEVHGLGASKSDLSNFTSLDDLVEANSREMIRSIDQAWLDKNLAHGEIRILKGPSSGDFFARCQWDGRVYLLNSGGSHHFSAARYIAKRIDVEVPLEGRLYEYSLNPDVVRDVIARFEVLAIPEGWPAYHQLHELLRANDASYYWKMLPRPWKTFRAYFLPKSEPRTLRIAGLLKEKGVFDVGACLSGLLQRQQAYQDQQGFAGMQSRLPGHVSAPVQRYRVAAQ